MKKKKLVKFLNHTFIAGKHNSYKPHLTRYHGMAVFLLVIFIFSMMMNLQKPDVKGAKTNLDASNVEKAINNARTRNGLEELKVNQSLNTAAEKKAEDIFDKQYWGHKSPSGKAAWAFMSENGYNYSIGGENLAKDYNSAEDVTDAWLASIKHRENLLSKDYRDIGISVKEGKLMGRDSQVIVTIYGTKRGEEVAGANTDNMVSKYSSFLLDRIGFYSNPISPVLLLMLAFIGIYSVFTAIAHVKIGKAQGIKNKTKRQRINSHKLGIIIFFATLFNVLLAFLLPRV